MQSEISLEEDKKYRMISLLCRLYKKGEKKIQLIDTENRLVVARGRR